ncbi:MAG: hypothetical protein J3Q66DRAFT_370988 [Benniella sp.]|nr:MAG: hypothetical protein J3Q66DRAFT_370988 [Benniella sp.]
MKQQSPSLVLAGPISSSRRNLSFKQVPDLTNTYVKGACRTGDSGIAPSLDEMAAMFQAKGAKRTMDMKQGCVQGNIPLEILSTLRMHRLLLPLLPIHRLHSRRVDTNKRCDHDTSKRLPPMCVHLPVTDPSVRWSRRPRCTSYLCDELDAEPRCESVPRHHHPRDFFLGSRQCMSPRSSQKEPGQRYNTFVQEYDSGLEEADDEYPAAAVDQSETTQSNAPSEEHGDISTGAMQNTVASFGRACKARSALPNSPSSASSAEMSCTTKPKSTHAPRLVESSKDPEDALFRAVVEPESDNTNRRRAATIVTGLLFDQDHLSPRHGSPDPFSLKDASRVFISSVDWKISPQCDPP